MNINEYLKNLEYLVNIDSGPNCDDGLCKVADFFQGKFDEMGWIIESYAFPPQGKCIICKNREADHYDLMLIGHLDTVFPAGTAAERPFRVDGDKAYGPGVLDMKQGSLLMYYILSELPEEINNKLNIIAVFNPDEEIGSIYSEKVYAKYAEITDYAYIYEGASADGARCVERKGSIGLTIGFNGKAGHCGYVFTNGAKSAISEMARWIVRFDSLQSEERNTTVNVGIANGGMKSNVVAPYAEMKVDIRIPNNAELERVESTLAELLIEAEERGIGIDIKKKSVSRALVLTDEGKSYVKHVEDLTKASGIDYFYRYRGGLSDANKISHYGAICLDAMGPSGDDDHCPDEYLNIDSVIPSYDLSMLLIRDLADRK